MPSCVANAKAQRVMKLEVVRFHELTGTQLAQWREWQAADPALASPYFRPEFVEAIAAVREDVFIGLIDDGIGFFPFERGGRGIGGPVGGIISDYQGLIARQDLRVNLREVVQRCGLRAWDFDHVPAAQSGFSAWASATASSPIVDVTKPAAGGSAQSREQILRLRRKLAREHGPVVFEMHRVDDAALATLLSWKSAQYVASRASDLFAPGWIREVVINLSRRQSPEFAGMLAVLRAGDRPVAAHFGLRSRDLLHYWFPAYDATFSAYAPGRMLLVDMIDAASAHGIRVIDFGKGEAVYKSRLANGQVALLEGSVVTSPWLRVWRRGRSSVAGWIRRSPLAPAARKVRRLIDRRS